MTVITPTSSFEIERSSVRRLLTFRNFAALRPIAGPFIRLTADVASVCLMFLFGWFVISGHGTSPLVQNIGPITLIMGSICIPACFVYAGMGLYTRPRDLGVLTKIGRIGLVNLILFTLAAAILTPAQHLVPVTVDLLFTTIIGAIVPLSLTRVAVDVLRWEDQRTAAHSRENIADMRKILVIGGAGYIGSALTEQLLRLGLQVRVLDAMHYGEQSLSAFSDNPNLTVIRDDFRCIEVLTRAMTGVGSVIHLGGVVGDPACALDTDLTIDVNVTATKFVGEIAKAHGVRRFIFASSCSVYGAADEVMDERSHFNPQSLYARTKVASEAVLENLQSDEFAVTCLRFGTIYGVSGRMRFDLVVNLLCAKAVYDRNITVYGPDQWRPFVHVEDVSRAITMALQAPINVVAGQAFNVGSDKQNYRLGQVAELIKRQVPAAKITSDETFVDKRNYRVSFAKIRSRLGFEPAWSLERGIAQLIKNVRTNRFGHYSQPAYSNALYLKEGGSETFSHFKITGWENELMSIDRITSTSAPSRLVA
jgi:nucleoside-diphosphate-sugar epimerase